MGLILAAGNFQENPLSIVSPGSLSTPASPVDPASPNAQEDRLRQLFADIDTDESGSLDQDEIAALAKSLGVAHRGSAGWGVKGVSDPLTASPDRPSGIVIPNVLRELLYTCRLCADPPHTRTLRTPACADKEGAAGGHGGYPFP
jgi:hypothetical protein